MDRDKREKLIKQILKFGVVGGLAFAIDFVIFTAAIFMGVHHLAAGALGFTISLVFNYLASMAFVFERKENTSRRREFLVFLALSVVGLMINEAIIWLVVDLVYLKIPALQAAIPPEFAKMGSKIAATGVVMIYNFVSRKIFLEKKEG